MARQIPGYDLGVTSSSEPTPTPPGARGQRRDQRNLPFETPTQEQIVAMTAGHVEAMETTNSDRVWTAAGMHFVLITLIGRKTGASRKTPLPYWLDDDDHRIVIASFAGADRHPAWYFNMADPVANPRVEVRERDRVFWCEVEVLDGDEYERIWNELVVDRPFYVGYQAKTSRQIPLLRLRESAD